MKCRGNCGQEFPARDAQGDRSQGKKGRQEALQLAVSLTQGSHGTNDLRPQIHVAGLLTAAMAARAKSSQPEN